MTLAEHVCESTKTAAQTGMRSGRLVCELAEGRSTRPQGACVLKERDGSPDGRLFVVMQTSAKWRVKWNLPAQAPHVGSILLTGDSLVVV